jgi:type IV pilus assembly protein PilA
MSTNKRGFTLLEILLVIGIIATLALVVVVALDPAKRFEDARNSRRLSDVQSILSAVQQYLVDNKGAIPDGIANHERQLGIVGGGCELTTNVCSISDSSCVDLSSTLARYLKEIPYDPQNGSVETTHYAVVIDLNNIITVKACDSTDGTIASVSR